MTAPRIRSIDATRDVAAIGAAGAGAAKGALMPANIELSYRTQQVQNRFSLNIAVQSPVCLNATQDSDVSEESDAVRFSLQIARSAIRRAWVLAYESVWHVNCRWKVYVQVRAWVESLVPNPQYGGNSRT